MSGERARSEEPRRRPAPRRRRLSPALVAVLVAAAFLVGAGVGYVVRGAPSSGDGVSVERSVPVVTVTVETP